MLKDFNDDKQKLGAAERFLHGYISVPHYETRVTCMLIKSEFREAMQIIKPGLSSLLQATEGTQVLCCIIIYILLMVMLFAEHNFFCVCMIMMISIINM